MKPTTVLSVILVAGFLFGCSASTDTDSGSRGQDKQSSDSAVTESGSTMADSGASSPASGSGSSSEPDATDLLEEFAYETSLTERLGSLDQIGEFKISPPEGYSKRTPPGRTPGVEIAQWAGKQRVDGTTPMIQAMIMGPKVVGTMTDVDSLAGRMVDGYTRRRKDPVVSETTYGLIDGIRFSRRSITGIEPNTGKKVVCIMFIAIDGDRCVQLFTQDIEDQVDALALGEAAPLSLQKPR